jgi:hypothetical protein
MFMVSDAEAASIRSAYFAGGAESAARELRRVFPGLLDNEATRASAVAIAGWERMEPQRIRPRRRPGSPPRGP